MCPAWVWVAPGETGALSGTEDDGFEVWADEGFCYPCGKVEGLAGDLEKERKIMVRRMVMRDDLLKFINHNASTSNEKYTILPFMS